MVNYHQVEIRKDMDLLRKMNMIKPPVAVGANKGLFFFNGKNHRKRKNSKTSRNMPKLAIRPTTRGL